MGRLSSEDDVQRMFGCCEQYVLKGKFKVSLFKDYYS